MLRITLFCVGNSNQAVAALRRIKTENLPAFNFVVSDGSDESSVMSNILAGHHIPIKHNNVLRLEHAVNLATKKGEEVFGKVLENYLPKPLRFYLDQEPDGDDFKMVDVGIEVGNELENLIPEEGDFHLLVIGHQLPIVALAYSINLELSDCGERILDIEFQGGDGVTFELDGFCLSCPESVDLLVGENGQA
mgnify:CR=1 FL=1